MKKEGRPIKPQAFKAGDAIYYHNHRIESVLPGRVLEAKPWRVKIVVDPKPAKTAWISSASLDQKDLRASHYIGGSAKEIWVKPKNLSLQEESN